jgi:hypothetical protein
MESDDPFADLPDALDASLSGGGAQPVNDPAQPAMRTGKPQAKAVSRTRSEHAGAALEQTPARSPSPSRPATLPTSDATGAGVAVAAPAEAADVVEIQSLEDLQRRASRRRLLRLEAPSWMLSLLIHVGILLLLAAIHPEPMKQVISVLTSSSAIEGEEDLQSFDISGPELDSAASESDQPLSETTPVTEVTLPTAMELPTLEIAVDAPKAMSMVESILPSSALSPSSASLTSTLGGRSSSRKAEMVERFGGNAASEKSVAMALKWIAGHQARNGGWTFGHSAVCRGECKDDGSIPQSVNGATALAILPFLGAGQTHMEGSYKDTVKRGLAFLISNMKVKSPQPMGSWHEAGGSMYSHGLAAIAICEAYAMTRDPDLLQPAQLAINFIVDAQDPRGGGWRYEPKQAGDTSVVGWQLMALKSGAMGNLLVPPESFRRANAFLDSVSINDGAYYGYDQLSSDAANRAGTTAVGLLCRMYMGWPKDHPGLREGVSLLTKRGPSLDDIYYSYYATQVLRHQGGPEWERWNTAMRDGLVNAQVKDGHAAGSWIMTGGHNGSGGRLYCTAMATMILEVYYRHLPLYSEKSADEEFEL